MRPSHAEKNLPTVIFRNGAVYTGDPARSWADTVVIGGGKVLAVGGADTARGYVGEADDLIDLDGRAVLPGFFDAHAHPVLGGVERGRCDLSGVQTLAAYETLIDGYARSHPHRSWILGGGWAMSVFDNGTPTRQVVDRLVSDRPVYLPNRDHHSAWVNSRALELAGIDARTPDPADGRIERDAEGNPTGALHEGAMTLVERLVPPDTQAEYDEGLREAQAYLHSLGIVGWQDALVRGTGSGPSVHTSYLSAQAEGWLTAKVAGALWWDRFCPADGIADQVNGMVKLRAEARAAGDQYTIEHVKVMQDGVTETFTAAMLEPYLDGCGHATDNRGISFLDRDLVRDVTIALDAVGFDVHFHALGDRAVREVLDAIEAAGAANGTSGRRHQLAHLQVVHPEDITRFRRLSAAANLQPLWASHEPQMDELTVPYLGRQRAGWQYPFGDLHRDGALLAMGSDWPVTSPDPLAGIHVAVNRVLADAPAGTRPLGIDQSLPLGVSISAYTAGSTFLSRFDHRSGALQPGLDADLVVLDGNPFDAPPAKIASHRVTRTYAGGQLVHLSD
jgi:predicted amidohydrolase YtcJ